MFPVYGLAEASLAVSFAPVGAGVESISLNRHRMTVGTPAQFLTRAAADAVTVVSVGRAIPYCRLRVTADDDVPQPEGTSGTFTSAATM